MRPQVVLLLALGLPGSTWGQSTQGLICGKVSDMITGNGIAQARVSALNRFTGVERSTLSDRSGNYILTLLSPGIYRLQVSKYGFQSQELHGLELTVAAALQIAVPLRPLEDVWESGQHKSLFLPGNAVLPFYGPDVDLTRTGNFEADLGSRGTLESTLSRVVQPSELRDLPLAGRDVYALLITLPGVNTDTSTGRGLGLTVNGQRPSSSNYLLDGLENNNYLITGPLTTVAPEAIQEYRVSTSNYSAEYGRTSGFIANAVSRVGGEHWHGTGYSYFGNDVLDASDFQRNRAGLPRTPLKDVQPGFSIGGPALLPGLTASLSFEYLRFRSSATPRSYVLPARQLMLPAGSFGAALLNGFRPLEGPNETAQVTLAAPDSLNRFLGLPRLDYVFHEGADRLFVRSAIANIERPDLIWSPYPGYSSPLVQKAISLAGGWLGVRGANFTNEARAGYSMDDLHFDRAHAEVPVLVSEDLVTLPGSPSSYSYRNRTHSLELLDNIVWASGKHVMKAGAGVLLRGLQGSLDFSGGYYAFATVDDFVGGFPERARLPLSRTALQAGQYAPPPAAREFQYRQFFAFAQDSYRVKSRLVLNYGIRYEYFGPPVSTGTYKDVTVRLGPGPDLAQQLTNAVISPPPAGDQTLFRSSKDNWAIRLGFTYSLRRNGRTIVRGGLGTFYDRPFDNLWQNVQANSFVLGTVPYFGQAVLPLASYYPRITRPSLDTTFSRLYLFPDLLRTPQVTSWFLGVEHQVTRTFTVEVNGLGSWGHHLFTTDYVNRGLFNPALSNIVYYGSADGFSYYSALAVSARRRTSRSLLSLAYTWSHSIDNQSEPLRGEFFDLLQTQAGANSGNTLPSTFSRQFDWQADKGNSDFDQRHNLVFDSIWNLPAPGSRRKSAILLRNWRVAQIAGIHSGFPFTVVTGAGSLNRPDLINPALAFSNQRSVPGGVQLLNRAAFHVPADGSSGNLGRNSLIGPGFYSLDLSLARTFPIAHLGETCALTFRADAFNVLNHANLGTPNTAIGSQFGQAFYGRSGFASTFPALTPLTENGRRIQLLLRFDF